MAKLHMLNSVRDTINTSFVLQDGEDLVVVDGGFPCEAPYLHEYLLGLGGKVKAWFLTHNHGDHVGAMISVLRDYDDITVEKVYYHFPSNAFFEENEPKQTTMPSAEQADLIRNTLKKEQIPAVTVEEGDVYTFGSISVRVLLTPDETMPSGINDTSCVYLMEVNGQKILFLGDLGVKGGNRLLERVDLSMLCVDYVQMAHHGQGGVDRPVYEAIRPRFCLWCTPTWLWDNIDRNLGRYDSGQYKTVIVRGWMSEMRCVERHYRMWKGTQVIKL